MPDPKAIAAVHGFGSNPGWTFTLIGFFGVILAANIALIVIASSGTPSQLMAEDSYAAGLRYDETLEAARVTQALGWDWALTDCEGRACVAVFDRGGVPLDGATADAALMRMSDETLDQHLRLTQVGPGRFVLPEGLASGLWQLTLTVEKGDATGTWSRPIMLPK